MISYSMAVVIISMAISALDSASLGTPRSSMVRQITSASCSLASGKSACIFFISAVVELMISLFRQAFTPAVMVLIPGVSMHSGRSETS